MSDRLIVAKSNRGIPDPVGLDDIAGNQINPATVEKLDELKTLLTSLNAKDFSTQATLALIKAQIDLLTFDSGNVLLTTGGGGVDPVGLKNAGGSPINPATNGTLQKLETLLTSINDKDIATEATLAALKALLDAVVSTNNSSTSVLGSGAIFTGTFEDVLKYAHITIQVRTDQPSATDGLEIQWSSNGTDIDDTDVFTIPANNGKVFTFGPQARFFRIKYTNGATAQTVFRLHIILKPFSQKPSSHRVADSIVTDDDAELVKAVLTAESETGIFVNIKASSAGALVVSTPPPIAPPGTTSVVRTEFGSVGVQDDNVFIVPNGETLTITRFSAGAESDTTAGNVIELFDDPNGDGTVLSAIDVIFASGVSDQHDLSEIFVGDGTRAIRMRRRRLSGGSKEMFGRWEGFF